MTKHRSQVWKRSKFNMNFSLNIARLVNYKVRMKQNARPYILNYEILKNTSMKEKI